MLADNVVFANRYRIVRKIATGGMGVVYEARHLETERDVALKVMLPQYAENEPLRERFRLEAKAAAKVASGHVVEMLDAGVDEQTGSPFLVMELLRGEDLSKRMARRGALPAEEVVRLVEETAKGLDALHRASIVHRDLKPSNLFVAEREGESPRVKVLDLGVAKRVAETAGTTAAVGTPFYMAPEQLENGKITPQTDVFALGMVAYSLLAGGEYWQAEAKAATSTISLALTMLGGPTDPASVRAKALGVLLPSAFDAWFAKATARSASERFSSAIEAASALRLALSGATSSTAVDAPRPGDGSEAPLKQPGHELAFAETKTLDLPSDTGRRAKTISRRSRRSWPLWGLLAGVALVASVAVISRRLPKEHKEEESKKTAIPVEIASIACPKAEASAPSLARIVEMSACARLGVELAVPFGREDGGRLAVRFEPQEKGSRVVLEVGEMRAEGLGATPIVATNEAIAALAPKLKLKPMDPAAIAAWGETDEASARRLSRAVRRHAHGFQRYDVASARALVEASPSSPIAHLMLAYALRRDAKADAAESQAEKEKALGLLSRLPQGRAGLVEGMLHLYLRGPSNEEVDQGVALLFKSYEPLALDPDFASLYTLCGFVIADQTPAMVDRLIERDRIAALPLVLVMVRSLADDRARQDKYLGLVQEALPEARGRLVLELVELNRVEEARAALSEARALGDPNVSKADLAEAEATIALAKLDGKAAIKAADEMFGEPNVDVSRRGAALRLEALLLQGQIKEALAVFAREVGRLRLLGLNDEAEEVEARRQAIVALTGQTKPNRAEAQKMAEAFRKTDLPFARQRLAFRAGLALEATGSTDEALAAYRLALSEPYRRGFEAIAARVRLAELSRRAGKRDEAAVFDAEVARVWADADPGLVALVARLL